MPRSGCWPGDVGVIGLAPLVKLAVPWGILFKGLLRRAQGVADDLAQSLTDHSTRPMWNNWAGCCRAGGTGRRIDDHDLDAIQRLVQSGRRDKQLPRGSGGGENPVAILKAVES